MRKRIAFPIALLFSFGLLELGARMLRSSLEHSVPSYYYRRYLDTLVQPSPVLIWEGRAEADAEILNSQGEKTNYKLNALGWRDADFNPFSSAKNGLVLGDSFSFGMGVRMGARFSERIELALPGLSVWNLGVMGYAPDQYLLLAERWLPPMSWSFLIVQLANNDLADVASHRWVGQHSSSGIPSAIEAPGYYRWLNSPSEAWNLFASFLLLGRLTQLPEDALRTGLQRLLFSLREIAKLAMERKVPLILLQASDWGEPVYGKKMAEAYRDGVRALAREMNMTLIEAAPQELLPFPDLHWTERAHAKVAELLLPHLSHLSAEWGRTNRK